MKYIPLETQTPEGRAIVNALLIADVERLEYEAGNRDWLPAKRRGYLSVGVNTPFRLAIPESRSSEIPNSSPFDKDGWREFTGTEEVIEEGDQASARGQSATPELSGFTGGRERLTTTNSTLTITT